MKNILIVLSLMLIVACESERKIDYSIIHGKIEMPVAEAVLIEGNDLKAEILIENDGSFRDTLKLDEPGFYTLSHGREVATVYLMNGQNLNLSLNTEKFDESLTYSGTGSIENNYLAKKTLINEELKKQSQNLYMKEENTFLSSMDSIKLVFKNNLMALDNVDQTFMSAEDSNLEYDHFSRLSMYGQRHSYYMQTPDYEVSENFLPEAFKSMKFDDKIAYRMSDSYRTMALNNAMDKLFGSIGDDYQSASVADLGHINEIKIEALKNHVIGYIGSFLVSPGNENMHELYTYFKDNTSDPKIKESLTTKYNKVKDLTKGKPSPQFNKYENHSGGTVSLTNLKGKYVYIDVWATWCGPCIREIPALKQVEDDFKGRNIQFVSTSIDVADQREAWIKMVKDKDLGGLQLMADNDWNSEFIKDYAIDGIPRFILIDPNGNIINADAPRPSNPRLVEMLESLNI